jgi:hypothetical protein
MNFGIKMALIGFGGAVFGTIVFLVTAKLLGNLMIAAATGGLFAVVIPIILMYLLHLQTLDKEDQNQEDKEN